MTETKSSNVNVTSPVWLGVKIAVGMFIVLPLLILLGFFTLGLIGLALV